MSKICIVDLDGVIANVDARFARADAVQKDWMKSPTAGTNATDIYWRTVFDPEQVHLDALIDGVPDALSTLCDEYYTLVFLTSRPESMREATEQWLVDQAIFHFIEKSAALFMKPKAFQYTKTVVWKAGMVQMLASLYDAHEVLVVDDEAANRDHLAAVLIEAQASFKPVIVESLEQAVAYIRDGKVTAPDLLEDDHPF